MGNGRKVTISWSDIQIGDSFDDGSSVIAVHPSYMADVYSVKYAKCSPLLSMMGVHGHVEECVLSGDHLLLVDVSLLRKAARKRGNERVKTVLSMLERSFEGYKIPTLGDRHVYMESMEKALGQCDNADDSDPQRWEHGKIVDFLHSMNLNIDGEMDVEDQSELDELQGRFGVKMVEDEALEWDDCHPGENLYWLPVALINQIAVEPGVKLLCNGKRIIQVEYLGKRSVFCVKTETHRFDMNGLTHHNSVTLRNVILHCLTHGEEICIALVDLKVVEFEAYKGMKNIVAVANSVRECVEVLRIMRECMYARNHEMAKLGINDIKDFKPQQPTDEVMIFNHKMHDDDEVEIRLPDGEVKRVTVKEVEAYLDHVNK